MDAALQKLVDEDEIKNLVVRLSLAMDVRDRTMYREAWADDVELDLPPIGGDLMHLTGRRDADTYSRDVIDLLSEFKATQHVSTNHLVTVTGDVGSLTCYTLAQHVLPLGSGESWLMVGARYDLTAERLGPLGWRFVRFRLRSLWSKGNDALWEEAVRRVALKRV